MYTINGAATAPHPGTFSEGGTWDLNSLVFSATFTITSGATTVTGSKSGGFSTAGGAFIRVVPLATTSPGVSLTLSVHGGDPYTQRKFPDNGVSKVSITFSGSPLLGACSLSPLRRKASHRR